MGQGCCGSGGKKKVDTGVDYNTVMEIAQTTGMEMMELREYYADFLKEYPKGQVTKKEFIRLYQKFFPEGAKTKKNANKVFDSFDQDSNGTINFREFMIAVSVLSQGTLVQKLSLAFQLYDVNGDGVLTFDEILEIVKMMYMIALEQGRMQGLPAPEEFAKNLFQELDTDKNGEISLDEFTNVACQDPTMANLLLCNIEERQAWT